jgi:hypothetical protein
MAKDCPFENEAQLCTTFVAALDDGWTGWLTFTPEGYVRGSTMPDFKTQHPLNYEQIKATVDKWRPPFVPRVKQGALL